MINLDFMPSKSLALYLVRLFLTRTLAVLFLLDWREGILIGSEAPTKIPNAHPIPRYEQRR